MTRWRFKRIKTAAGWLLIIPVIAYVLAIQARDYLRRRPRPKR